jgi:predicted aldo/keto reductase-like oxidoreductase
MVTCLGLGGMGILSGQGIDKTRAAALVEEACRAGINLVETGRGYFDSEAIIGEALSRVLERVHVATKTFLRTAKRAARQIEESLSALGTKKIDIYQIHHLQYPKELEQIMSKGGAMEALLDGKRQGVIDFIGVTSHNPDVLVEALKTDLFDTAQLPLSVVERDFFDKVYPVAKARDIGIMIMKSLCGGHLKSVDQALRYVLSHDVASILVGFKNIDEFREDLACVERFTPLEQSELEALVKEASALSDLFCRRCRYCERECAGKVPVADIFRIEDYLILNATYARNEYRLLGKNATACRDCGRCEEICPYRLPVREFLKRAHRRLTRGKLEDFAVNTFRKVGLYDLARKIYFDLGGKLPER